MRVDFMIIGAMKCGTTTLAQRLAAHRQVSFSTIKEPCFFNERSDWREKIDRYHRLFEPVTVPGGSTVRDPRSGRDCPIGRKRRGVCMCTILISS